METVPKLPKMEPKFAANVHSDGKRLGRGRACFGALLQTSKTTWRASLYPKAKAKAKPENGQNQQTMIALPFKFWRRRSLGALTLFLRRASTIGLA